jgi:ABC-type multidrug transport system fused ATPase/permease subunit
MTKSDNLKLTEIDPEDFGDILHKIEKSFGLDLEYNSFEKAKTFGDICEVFEKNIYGIEKQDCTTQQAFYKIRRAISLTVHIDEKNINSKISLENIFARRNRRKNIKEFNKQLGIDLDILKMKDWLFWTNTILILTFLITFFFSWKIALFGLVLISFTIWVESKFSKEFNIETVEKLTELIARENYTKVRRQEGTINRNEIIQTIQKIFISDYGFEKEDLTKDAKLNLA